MSAPAPDAPVPVSSPTHPTSAPSTASGDRPGVVVHVAEASPERHQAILRNVANLVADLVDLPVEVVGHGPGVELLTGESGHAAAVHQIIDLGVRVLACGNTLNARDLTVDDLLAGVSAIPSGVGHLARRQLEGWAYLRP